MTDIRVKDLTEATVPGADYYLLTDSATDGVKKVKTTNVVKPADIGAASLAGAETLTNKTISGASNTLTNIPNAALTNSGVTVSGHTLALGGTLDLAPADLGTAADSTILSNISGALAAASANTITAVLDKQLGATQGSVAYRSATGWSSLAPGVLGQYLKTQGPGANPIYDTPAGGGDVLKVNNLSDIPNKAAAKVNLLINEPFATKALAAAYAPAVAPDNIWIGGVSAVGDSGPVVYKNNGTTTGDLVITLSDGTTLVGYDVSGPVINAAGCGLSPASTGAVNLAALKKAVSLCPVGGTVWVPPLIGTCTVDTSGGLSNAVLIDKTITFRNDANLKMSTAVQDTVGFNPSYMFKVTAENVKFCASMGSIEGSGTTFINEPSGDEGHCPGLIYVLAGHGFEFHSTLIKPPQIGIYARNTHDCNFDYTHIIGGYVGYQPSTIVDPASPSYGNANPSYLGSYHIGITLSGGDNHSFVGFKTFVGTDGGAVAQGIFSSGAGGSCNDIKIVGATADRPWEKLCYLYGDRHRVIGCTVHGTFPVNQQTSVFSDAIRLEGNDGLAEGNAIHNAASGIQVANGANNKVLNNALLNISGVGVAVQQLTAGNPVSGNEVRGNRVTHNGTSTATGPGIFVYSSLGDIFQPDVSGNSVLGYGAAETYGAIHIEAASPYNVYQPVANNNTLTSYTTGIKIKRGITIHVDNTDLRTGTAVGILIDSCGSGVVSNSRGVSVGAWALACDSSSDVEFANNAALGPTTNGIRGITTGAVAVNGCHGRGNRYTSAPVIGTSVLSAASATTTVTHGGVAPNALIFLTPISGAFSAKNAADGYYTGPNGNNFNVINGNGNIGAGTETFGYQIIQ